MPVNQKGYTLPVLGIILLLLIAITAGFTIKNKIYPGKAGQVANPEPQVSITPSPSSELVPFPELKQAWNLPQVEFKGQDFPFTFSYPEYFDRSITDVETRKLEALKEDPKTVWRLLSQVRIGVPDNNAVYDYSNCDQKVMILISKYANIENSSLYNFIKIIRAQYPGGGITQTFQTYEKDLSEIDYPRPNSYRFRGVMSENAIKEVYFEYGDSFYNFYLSGGCGTGEGYSEDAEVFFDNILKNLKFK